MVDRENATTVKILNDHHKVLHRLRCLQTKELINLAHPTPTSPIPHGKAISMENFSASVYFAFYNGAHHSATYELTREGTIAVDSADAMAIGIVVRSSVNSRIISIYRTSLCFSVLSWRNTIPLYSGNIGLSNKVSNIVYCCT